MYVDAVQDAVHIDAVNIDAAQDALDMIYVYKMCRYPSRTRDTLVVLEIPWLY